MSALVPPHGGVLSPLKVEGEELRELLGEARTLPRVILSSKEMSDLMMLGMGAFSPLKGFMGIDDYRNVLKDMRLKSGLLWPIPITLSVHKEDADRIKEGSKVALFSPEHDEIVGSMLVEEKYSYDKKAEVLHVFGTDDQNHPGVQVIYRQGDMYLGGQVKVFSDGGYPERFPEYARPVETRAIFESRRWKTVAAFQTRNPMHRSHEYLTKIALEVCDGLLIHPIVGKLKADDVPSEVRMECYRLLIENYYPRDRVVLKVYPMEMRYAGPREAILHAIIRQNFGCSHLIVGRDHAGVGSYYPPFAAQEIFDMLGPDDLYIQPLKLDSTFWCYRCDSMASEKTCPHATTDRLSISGTRLREMLAKAEVPPKEFIRPEIADILINYYRRNKGGKE